MNREDKYPNTETFTLYNNNPKGKITCDCVVRAIALADDKQWKSVLQELTVLSINTGLMIHDVKCFEKYLEIKGWKKNKQMKKEDSTKYTGKEFCKLFKNKTVIINIGTHHTSCVKDGKIFDVWDCSNGSVGNFWTK